MGEFLPFLLGCVVGAVLTRVPAKARAIALVPTCIGAGVLASGINGELESGIWPVFVSFDSLLVWLGVAITTATLWYWERRATAA